MPPIRPLHGMQGRLRQHILKLGRHYAIGNWQQRKDISTSDPFLDQMLESGQLFYEEFQQIVDECHRNQGPYSFLTRYPDSLLDKADDVFLLKYGHTPKESEWATKFQQICRNLERDSSTYDYLLKTYHDELSTVQSHVGSSVEHARVPVKYIWNRGEPNPIVAFFEIVFGLFFLSMAFLVAPDLIRDYPPLSIGNIFVWLFFPLGIFGGMGVGLLYSAFFARKSVKYYKCPLCNTTFDMKSYPDEFSCPKCGVTLFSP